MRHQVKISDFIGGNSVQFKTSFASSVGGNSNKDLLAVVTMTKNLKDAVASFQVMENHEVLFSSVDLEEAITFYNDLE